MTILGTFRSKIAAERAEIAAKLASAKISLLEGVVDFTTAISTLEEIKRAHRLGQWHLLPDRYASIRKMLISIRSSNFDLTDEQLSAIQSTLTNLSMFEKAVERAISNKGSGISTARFNNIIADDIDNLFRVLAELKVRGAGV